jgi:hypothetical protein
VVVYNKNMCFYLNVCLVYIVCFCEKYIAKSLSLSIYIYLHLTLQYIGHRSNCLYAGIGCSNNLKLTLTTRWPPIIVFYHKESHFPVLTEYTNLSEFRLFSACEPFRFCTTGLPSDVTVEVGDMSFHLHKVLSFFPGHILDSCIFLVCARNKEKMVISLLLLVPV